MIIISIGGGLGNQMFQYAFYTKMRHCYPEETIKLDMYNSFYKSHNGYELKKIFGLNADECSVDDVANLSEYYPLTGKMYQVNRIIYEVKRRLGIHKSSFYEQKDYVGYYDDFLHLEKGKSYFFKGAFANVKYFSDIKDEILNIYTFPQITDDKNQKIIDKIFRTKSVSVHVRRGDYEKLGIEMTNESFYRNAMKYIESRIGSDVHYFFFSNDSEWVMNHFSDVQNMTVITWNLGEDSFKDMYLMSLCKHNIVANSTFSFWGAYLNRHDDKIVIVPNLPFTGSKYLFKDDDWIVMENKEDKI